MDDNQFLQAVFPVAKSGLGVCTARLLALPAFLASAVGAKDALSESLVWSMWMEPMMIHQNGGLNLEKVKWLRKMKSKNIGWSQFLTAKCRLDFTTPTNECKKKLTRSKINLAPKC